MPDANSEKLSLAKVSLLLAGGMLALPFIVLIDPKPPVPTFPAEWLAIALGTIAAIFLLIQRNVALTNIPQTAWWLLAFATLLLLHATFASPTYSQLPIAGFLYILFAAQMIWAGTQLGRSINLNHAATTLAMFLLVGALINAVAGVIQFYGRPIWLNDFVSTQMGSRAYGNLGHPNIYSNHLALGLAALLFLWMRGRVSTIYGLFGVALLCIASTLSASRIWLLLILWLAGLMFSFSCSRDKSQSHSLKRVAVGLLILTLFTQVTVPWINEYFALGPPSQGSGIERAVSIGEYTIDGRWQAWLMAWHIFLDSPFFGIGVRQFASAAFELGLGVKLAGHVWTSPHNLILHLLAETGFIGTVLALGALTSWWWQATRHQLSKPTHSLWLVIAVIGIETLHSMLEFPLWNAQFLGVTALMMGLGIAHFGKPEAGQVVTRIFMWSICLTLVFALGMTLKDYLRLDASRVTGTRLTLANEQEKKAATQAMRELATGPLAPVAEGWMLLGAPLNRDDLKSKLAMGERVIHYWPASEMLVKHAIFLALDGKAAEANALIVNTLRAFPKRCAEIVLLLQQAEETDHAAIAPLLSAVRTATCTK